MSLDPRARPGRSFIVPTYNAAPSIEAAVEEVRGWLARRVEPWELILVDDGSSDGTPRILREIARRHPDEAIRVVQFTQNRGKGFAVRAGMGIARGRLVIHTDCDLAYPLENVDRVLQELEGGADAAIACRVLPESTYLISPSFFSYLYTRHVMGRLFNMLCRILTVPRLLDTQAGLKGFRRDRVRPLLGLLVKDGFSADVEMLRALLDRGARIVEIPVSFRYNSEPSTVRFAADSLIMLRDLLDIRLQSRRGRYGTGASSRGFPLIRVHADDFGLSPGVNRAIQQGLEIGALAGASILVGTPYSGEALRWAAAHPAFEFGVHLTLTQGRPTLPASQVPSLVSESGRFLSLGALLRRLLLGRVRMREIRAEWRAQIRRARAAGIRVSHLDSHQHVHLLPWIFWRAVLRLARQENVAIRAMDGPICGLGSGVDWKGAVLLAATRLALAGRRGVPAVHGAGTLLMKEPNLAVARALLARMKPGRTYELIVHPGVVDAALRDSGDGYLDGRQRELALVLSEEFHAVFRHIQSAEADPLAEPGALPGG